MKLKYTVMVMVLLISATEPGRVHGFFIGTGDNTCPRICGCNGAG